MCSGPRKNFEYNILRETVFNMENYPWEENIAFFLKCKDIRIEIFFFEPALAELQVMQIESLNVLEL